MTKDVFINDLRRTLAVSLSSSEIEEHAKYYNDYIAMEMSKGKSEEQILDELGDPRLIGKSILEAKGDSDKQSDANQKAKTVESKLRMIPTWLTIILVVGVLVFIIVLLLRVFIQFLPVLLILIFAIAIVSFVRKLFK